MHSGDLFNYPSEILLEYWQNFDIPYSMTKELKSDKSAFSHLLAIHHKSKMNSDQYVL